MVREQVKGYKSGRDGQLSTTVLDSLEPTTLAVVENSESASRHFSNLSSAIFLFAARVIAAIVQLRVVERIWGGQYAGLNALSNQVLLYVTLLELGLAQAAISLLYEPIMARRFEDVSSLILALRNGVRRSVLWGALLIAPIIAVYAWLVRTSVPFLVVVTSLELIVVSGLIQLAAVHFQAYLNSSERIDRVNYIFGSGYLLKTGFGLGLAILRHEFLWLPATIAILTLGEFLALRIAFRKAFPRFTTVECESAKRSLRSKGKFVLIHKIGGLAYNQSDFIILSLTTSLMAVKDYAKYQYVSAALLSVLVMIFAALTATLARHQLTSAPDSRRSQYVVIQGATCLIATTIMLGYWFTASTVVRVVFGAHSAMPWPVIVLFGIALMLNIVKIVDDVFIAARGAFEVGSWLPVLEAPMYLALAVLLSKRFGFAGILTASITTNLLVTVVARGIVLAQPVFGVSVPQWYTGRLRNVSYGIGLAIPILLAYIGCQHLAHSEAIQCILINGVAATYAIVGAKKILAAGFRRQTQRLTEPGY